MLSNHLNNTIEKATIMLEQPNCGSVLLSWDHGTEEFALHNLSCIEATANYFSSVDLQPLSVIGESDIVALQDMTLRTSVGQMLTAYLENVAYPPLKHHLGEFAPPTKPETPAS